jgi:hypothetical protein
MTDEDLKLIRQIIADGGRKYTAEISTAESTIGWLTWAG